MPTPEVLIETLDDPVRYSRAQVKQAIVVATSIDRGRLILCVPPAGPLLPPPR